MHSAGAWGPRPPDDDHSFPMTSDNGRSCQLLNRFQSNDWSHLQEQSRSRQHSYRGTMHTVGEFYLLDNEIAHDSSSPHSNLMMKNSAPKVHILRNSNLLCSFETNLGMEHQNIVRVMVEVTDTHNDNYHVAKYLYCDETKSQMLKTFDCQNTFQKPVFYASLRRA